MNEECAGDEDMWISQNRVRQLALVLPPLPRGCHASGSMPCTMAAHHKQHINKKPNLFDKLGLINGGETGIRTLGGIAATIDFESIPFGHSGISPRALILTQPESGNQRKSRCRSDDWLLNRQSVPTPPPLARPRPACRRAAPRCQTWSQGRPPRHRFRLIRLSPTNRGLRAENPPQPASIGPGRRVVRRW